MTAYMDNVRIPNCSMATRVRVEEFDEGVAFVFPDANGLRFTLSASDIERLAKGLRERAEKNKE